VTERHSYAEVAKRVPEAVICLLSALTFHEITTQSPASVWIALGKGARTPAITSPSLRIIRLSGPSLTEGIEHHQVEGVPVRVYSTAKTVADWRFGWHVVAKRFYERRLRRRHYHEKDE